VQWSDSAPSWRTPNAARVQRRRAGPRQRMECGGLPPLCGGRVEPGSASSRCHRAGVEPGLRTRCCQPRVQAGRLGARARAAGRPLRARETVAQQGCLSNLREHQQQRDVRSARQWKEELGRGAVGSSCREGLCSWQRISQFWAPAGKEGLLGLETLWCNKRWPVLLRHGRPVKGSKS
jgi:hypothetical protein